MMTKQELIDRIESLQICIEAKQSTFWNQPEGDAYAEVLNMMKQLKLYDI